MHVRYEGPIWNDRFLPRLTTKEIANINKEEAVLILPIASVEQHGLHLPVFTDSLLNESLIGGALSLLPNEASVWLLPPLHYGKSNEHHGFSGTFSLSTNTVNAILTELFQCMQADGWKKVIVINSHGGNPELLSLAARDARLELGLQIYLINTGGMYSEEALSIRELEYGIHGGALETSLMLAIKPDWVHPDLFTAEYPEIAECSCFKLGGEMTFAWSTKDLSKTGVIGDPTTSTAEIGQAIYEKVTKRIAEAMMVVLQTSY